MGHRLNFIYKGRVTTFFLLTLTAASFADPPPGYYNSADPSTAGTLRTTLHAIIKDHTKIPYNSSGGTDTWTVLELADEDPNDATHVLDVYKNASYLKVGGGTGSYNREHTWPNSYGFPSESTFPYSDCHHLFLSDSSYNSSRGNNLYDTCSTGCAEKTTDVNDGQGGGSGSYPGNSNWTNSSGSGKWETWVGRRGDVARALFYLDVRYEGGTHISGGAEPDLILTDNAALIQASGSVQSVAYMGIKSVLLQWNAQDPPDDRERARNDVVYSFQHNRNPFIDHPEWVDCIFGITCGGAGGGAPAAPIGLTAMPGNGFVDLNWNDSQEPDLDGYNIYRALSIGGPYSLLNGSLLFASQYHDAAVTNEIPYYYHVTAVDTDTNESTPSINVSATPTAGTNGGTIWINEIHYDNVSTDTNEGIEIAGLAGTNVTGWTLIGYNGNGGAMYQTANLSGVIPNQQNGFGTLWFAFVGLQNGAPDGIALVDPSSQVIQFLSYEGVFTAADGVAMGMQSTNIGVTEPGSDAVDMSLQLTGTGDEYSDFTWASPAAHTRGLPNNNQTFQGPPPVPAASTWTMMVMSLLLLAAGTIVARRRPSAV